MQFIDYLASQAYYFTSVNGCYIVHLCQDLSKFTTDNKVCKVLCKKKKKCVDVSSLLFDPTRT